MAVIKTGRERGKGEKSSSQGTMPKTGGGNPPKHTKVKKGVSANGNGRPEGSRNVGIHIMAAARGQDGATDGKPRRIKRI